MNSVFSCDALLTHAEHYGVVAAHMDDEGCQPSRGGGLLSLPGPNIFAVRVKAVSSPRSKSQRLR